MTKQIWLRILFDEYFVAGKCATSRAKPLAHKYKIGKYCRCKYYHCAMCTFAVDAAINVVVVECGKKEKCL